MSLIMLVGDSVTAAFPVRELMPELNIVNRGVYGDNSELVLTRLDKDVVKAAPDTIFLLIGTNDMACGFTNAATIGNIDLILQRCNSGIPNVTVYLQSILPTRGLENRPVERIRFLNGQLQRLARIRSVRYLDIGSLFVNSFGEIHHWYSDDGLHLTAAGYSVWAETLIKIVKQP
jgi:lysophospholipase L1-like esterase